MYDVAIIGTGPAGLSAAINVRARGKTAIVIGNDPASGYLNKAPEIGNYLGMPGLSGPQMVSAFVDHALSAGVELREGRVISVMPFGADFMASVGSDVIDAHAVILALGAVPPTRFAGEEEYLGRGVSYCATCDGMLYRGHDVVVVGGSAESVHEAAFLQQIGCNVSFVSKKPVAGLPDEVPSRTFKTLAVVGDGTKVTGLELDGEKVACDCAFILRPAIAPSNLVAGLELDGSYIKVNRGMRTNIPGLYAAGDCTGKPLQVAKAVGEGLIAALSACEDIDAR